MKNKALLCSLALSACVAHAAERTVSAPADGVTPATPVLQQAVDAINARYGKGKVFSAAEGIGPRPWQMKRSKLSRRPTTRWDELLTVR